MKARLIVLFVILLSVGLPFVSAQNATTAKFKDVVEAKFRQWDKDGDGKLSAHEVNALVVKPGVTGDEAAAIAAIHAYYREHTKTNPVTKPQLTAASAAKKG